MSGDDMTGERQSQTSSESGFSFLRRDALATTGLAALGALSVGQGSAGTGAGGGADHRLSNRPYALVTEQAGRGAVYEGHGPQAQYVESTDTTYVAYRGPSADPYATAYDHEADSFADPVRIGENPLPDTDNHGVPSIVVDEDGRIVAFYGSHGCHHQVARTSEPYDVSSWDDLGAMDGVPKGTYPQPALCDGDIYVYYRTGPGWYEDEYPSAPYATIVRSEDGGETFEDLGPIVDSTGHPDALDVTYPASFSERDGRLHFTWFVAHDHAIPTTAASQHRSGVYHATYDPGEDAVYALDGARFETPITWDEYDDSAVEAFGRQDVNQPKHVHLEEGPAILFCHYDPASVNFDDGTSRIEWLVAFWHDGWEIERIRGAFATHLFDGGYARVTDDGRFEAHVVTGGDEDRLVDGSRGGHFEVYTYSDDGWGQTTVARARAESKGAPLSRVTTVRNGRDSFASLFQPASDSPDDFDVPLYAYGSAWDDADE